MTRRLLVPVVAVAAAIALDSGRLPATELLEESNGNNGGCGILSDYRTPDGEEWAYAHGTTAPQGWSTYASFYNRNNVHGGYFRKKVEEIAWHATCD